MPFLCQVARALGQNWPMTWHQKSYDQEEALALWGEYEDFTGDR